MIPDPASLTIFLLAAAALLLTPGPAVLYIVGRSVDQGWRAGVVSSLGLAMGSLVTLLATAFGLSAILLSSSVAFSVVRYLGAAYLVWLGIQRLRARDGGPEGPRLAHDSMRRIFAQGIVVNLLNPKSALFLAAFLPQFTDVARGHLATQIITLGLIFIGMGIVSDCAYAVAAGSVAGRLRGNQRLIRRQRHFTGTLYILLGLTAAFGGSAKRS